MRFPYWLLRLLPMWDYICPRCRREVSRNSHKCPHCGEKFPFPVRVPPKVLKDKKALEDYVHKHIFPKVSAWQRQYLAQYFTTIFSDGFESGDFSAWDGTSTGNGGVIAVQSTTKHHGTYACKADQSGLSAWAVAYKNFASTYSTVYARSYVRLSSLPSSGIRLYIYPCIFEGSSAQHLLAGACIYNDAGTLKWDLQYRTDTVEENHAYSTSPTIQANTWYYIEVRFTAGNGNGQVALYVNSSTPVISVTSLTNDDYNAGRLEVGVYSPSNTGISVYHDCIVVADTGPIGQEAAGQVYEINVDAVTQSIVSLQTQTIYNIAKDASVASQSLHAQETTFNLLQDAIAKALADLGIETTFNISKDAIVGAVSTPLIQSAFNLSPEAVVKVLAEVAIIKEGEVKVTRLFLVFGDLAIQIQGG